MKKQEELSYKVLNVVLSFEGSFTMQKLLDVLRKENIMNTKNKEQVLDTIDGILEAGIIRHIPHSEEYYVMEKE